MHSNQYIVRELLQLKGVHFLLTFKCDMECDHCFVWGCSQLKETFTFKQVKEILTEAKKLETVEYVSIEGGEPFMYHPIMLKAAKEASRVGFRVEILSNCYWAVSQEDAAEWLRPLAEVKGLELSLSSDFYHGENWTTVEVKNAVKAANSLSMKVGINAVRYPKTEIQPPKDIEGARVDMVELMYKGRATSKLAKDAEKKSWREFTKCPYENLTNPERVHVDPLGYVHVCQGISIGNAWRRQFSSIVNDYEPQRNQILEPLIRGGPVALVEKYNLPHDEGYADPCHLCYVSRNALRKRFPDILAPNQMYGEGQP